MILRMERKLWRTSCLISCATILPRKSLQTECSDTS